MQITIIRSDNMVGINRQFRQIDLSGLDPAIRVIQFDTDAGAGHIEHALDAVNGALPPNTAIDSIAPYQWAIDAWNALTPPPPAPPTIDELKAAKLTSINASCEAEIAAIKAGYPDSEVLSWPKQEQEARAYTADAAAPTPLLDALATARAIPKADLAGRIIAKADAFAQVSGGLIGKRQKLEDQIAAATTAAQVDAIAW